MGKASLPKTSINDTLDANRERKKQFGRERNAYSGATGVAVNSGSGFNSTTNKIEQVQTLKTAGDTMMGPLAFYPRVEFLNTGVTTLDISKATNEAYSSRVIVSGQSNAATISTISGAAHAGQILFLQAASSQTITINETGNISIPGSATSYVMTANEIILLQYDTTTTKWITVTVNAASSGGAGLADNNVWTGTNQFTGSYVTVTGSFSATGTAITLGNTSTDIITFGGKAGSDLNMGTYDITNLDNISFGAGTQNIADTTTPVNNLFVKQVRLQSGSLTTNKPNITSSSSGGNTVDLNFTTGSGFIIYEQGQPKHTFSGSSLTTPNILSSGTWTLTSDTNNPNTNGMFARVGGHVKVYTGGALKSLSDIGTGSGGASLSGNNTWTGSNIFQSSVSMTGPSVIIGDSSSDLLYIDSTISQNLDMGNNKITDLATPTSNYDAATKKYVDDNAGSGGGANTSLSNLGTTSINADLDPSANATRDLGSSSKKWRYIYAIQLVNAAVSATSLSMSGDIDMNGNDIDYVGGLTNTGNGTFAWSGTGSFQTTCNVTALYSSNIYIGQSSGDNVGFFGATPVGKQYIPANATLANVVMALRNLGLGS